MQINLDQVPFSTAGSYMAFSHLPAHFRGMDNEEGLFLRSIHGFSSGNRLVCRLLPLCGGKPVEYTLSATPWELRMETAAGAVRICFAEPGVVLLRGEGSQLGLRLEELSDGKGYNYIHSLGSVENSCLLINAFKNGCRYLLQSRQGQALVDQDWETERTTHCTLVLSAQEGGFCAALEEVVTEWEPRELQSDFDACADGQKRAYEAFCASMPEVPVEFEDTRMMAAYVNWSSIVNPCGLLKRPSMLMSKNWMTNVWSWDHCFNAMALAYHNPEAAWDQFMLLFDYQDPTGVLPDSVNDASISYNFCKPPIHGWALSRMMRVMELSPAQTREAYGKLERWTRWWFGYRDHDGDGVCEYYHGNDSGWDNSTAFQELPPVELPDLTAFLVLQMDVLSQLAARMGREHETREWKAAADRALKALLRHCFDGTRPRALHSGTHKEIINDSLILYLPIILGERLPEDVRAALLATLKSERFFTPYGFATESPASSHYCADGYWRGPIWAPSSLILIDGLYQCGELAFATEAARRFCKMVTRSGCAENFDALTGEGLRDRAYTWTSSAFLIMAHEYLPHE